MKKFLLVFAMASLMLIGKGICSPQQADAMTLEINNQIGTKLSVAVIFHDEDRGSWICKGWWSVPANSFKTINFPRHAKSKIWVHMHNKFRSWGSEKAWSVINEKFDYRVGKESCPDGTNRRQVAFDSFDIGQDGVVRLTARK